MFREIFINTKEKRYEQDHYISILAQIIELMRLNAFRLVSFESL